MQQLAPQVTPDDSQSLILLWGNHPSTSSATFTSAASCYPTQHVFITEHYFASQSSAHIQGEFHET